MNTVKAGLPPAALGKVTTCRNRGFNSFGFFFNYGLYGPLFLAFHFRRICHFCLVFHNNYSKLVPMYKQSLSQIASSGAANTRATLYDTLGDQSSYPRQAIPPHQTYTRPKDQNWTACIFIARRPLLEPILLLTGAPNKEFMLIMVESKSDL